MVPFGKAKCVKSVQQTQLGCLEKNAQFPLVFLSSRSKIQNRKIKLFVSLDALVKLALRELFLYLYILFLLPSSSPL